MDQLGMEPKNDVKQTNEKFKFKEPIVLVPIICLSMLRGIASTVDQTRLFDQVKGDYHSTIRAIEYHGILNTLAVVPGIFLLPFMLEVHGRKPAFILLFFLCLLSSIISYVPYNEPLAITGNFVVALIKGGVITVTTLAICEYCGPKHRFAYLVANKTLQIFSAQVTNILITTGVLSTESLYVSLGVVVIALACMGTVYLWPESPYWLANKGRIADSRAALMWLRADGDVARAELQALETRRRRSTPRMFWISLLVAILYVTVAKCSSSAESILITINNDHDTVKIELTHTIIGICGNIAVSLLLVLLSYRIKRKVVYLCATIIPLVLVLILFIWTYKEQINNHGVAFYVTVLICNIFIECGPFGLSFALSVETIPQKYYTDEITSAISQSRVSVIVGAAGCGKSTRAPLEVLRSCPDATVIVSGPRRVAAVGLARRVAGELGEKVGDTVGYQVRLDSKPPRPPAGSILYCTSGVLLRRLQANPGLHGCSHVFIDEAHERDVNTDITLLLLKRAVDLNPDLRVVVMSATLDADVFTRYFNSCPVVEVPGRTFPVETLYLEDIKQKYNLELPSTFENSKKEDGRPQVNCQEIVEVVKVVDRKEPEGAILVFLPGWAEIKQAKLLLDRFYDESTHLVLPVHSRLSTTDQVRMFSKPLPGVRKIVLATNIAETSITIPDVVYVVDSGAHKENTLKQGTGTASLDTVWVSGAGAKQRAGRAGRVQPGYCFKLYTKEKENEFSPFSTPEILRVPLEQTVLDCKTYAPHDKVEDFLSQLPEPPSSKAIQFAVNDLIDLGALSRSEELTRLGSLLSSFTVHPRLARGLLLAAVLGNSAAAANVLTHCADNVEVFANAADRKEEIREIKREFSATSDHAALHWMQEEFERARASGDKAAQAWCERYGLRRDRLNYVTSITNLYLEQLLKSPIVQPAPDVEELTRFSGIDELTPAALLCGPNSLLIVNARLRPKGKLKPEVRLLTSKGDRAHIGGESVNHDAKKDRGALFAYFGGFHSLERRALVVYKTSRVSPQAVLVLCQGDLSVGERSDDTTVLKLHRHKLDVHVPTSQVDHVLKAREMLSKTIEYYIERDPTAISYEENTTISRFKVRLVKAIGRILVEAHKQFEERSAEEFR